MINKWLTRKYSFNNTVNFKSIFASQKSISHIIPITTKFKRPGLLPNYIDSNQYKLNKTPFLVAIGSGKGGVGKSFIAANLSAKLALEGYNTLVMDLDFGSANLHTYFGIRSPKNCLINAIRKKNISFQDLILKTNIHRLKLIPGGKDELWGQKGFDKNELSMLWHNILNLNKIADIDIVIFDLGAGIHKNTVDFFTFANFSLLTLIPETTSIENAYSFLRAMLWNLILYSASQSNSDSLGQEILNILSENKSFNLNGYKNTIKYLGRRYKSLANKIFQNIDQKHIGLIVNQARHENDFNIGISVESICRNYFGFNTNLIGFLEYEEVAWKALRNQMLLIKNFPHSKAVKGINDMFFKIINNMNKFYDE